MNNHKIIRILFVCHGNICRSPMAEFILKAMVKAQGLEACEAMVDAFSESPSTSGR